jgi:hypothetical protein
MRQYQVIIICLVIVGFLTGFFTVLINSDTAANQSTTATVLPNTPDAAKQRWNQNMDRLNFAQDNHQGPEVCSYLRYAKIIAISETRTDLYEAYKTLDTDLYNNGWRCQ